MDNWTDRYIVYPYHVLSTVETWHLQVLVTKATQYIFRSRICLSCACDSNQVVHPIVYSDMSGHTANKERSHRCAMSSHSTVQSAVTPLCILLETRTQGGMDLCMWKTAWEAKTCSQRFWFFLPCSFATAASKETQQSMRNCEDRISSHQI